MDAFVNIYKKVLVSIIDDKSIKKIKENTKQIEFQCFKCQKEKNCDVNCNCRCHFHSCDVCDENECDVFKCKCENDCHEPDRDRINKIINSRKEILKTNRLSVLKKERKIKLDNELIVTGDDNLIKNDNVKAVNVIKDDEKADNVTRYNLKAENIKEDKLIEEKIKEDNIIEMNDIDTNDKEYAEKVVENVLTHNTKCIINEDKSNLILNFNNREELDETISFEHDEIKFNDKINISPDVSNNRIITDNQSDKKENFFEFKKNEMNIFNEVNNINLNKQKNEVNSTDESKQSSESLYVDEKRHVNELKKIISDDTKSDTIIFNDEPSPETYNINHEFKEEDTINIDTTTIKSSIFKRSEHITDTDPEQTRASDNIKKPIKKTFIKKKTINNSDLNDSNLEKEQNNQRRRRSKYYSISSINIPVVNNIESVDNDLDVLKNDPSVNKIICSNKVINKENEFKVGSIMRFTKNRSVSKRIENKESLVEEKTPDQIPLQKKMKANFVKYKIHGINHKEKILNNSDNLYIRDKSVITVGFDKLENNIKKEIYYDKQKLSDNVFEDFEKQTSWQSYTTLLITDILTDRSNAK